MIKIQYSLAFTHFGPQFTLPVVSRIKVLQSLSQRSIVPDDCKLNNYRFVTDFIGDSIATL
jgi:hypothetical protein